MVGNAVTNPASVNLLSTFLLAGTSTSATITWSSSCAATCFHFLACFRQILQPSAWRRTNQTPVVCPVAAWV
eukprot:4621844-Pyramimonas_sp.AAC.1